MAAAITRAARRRKARAIRAAARSLGNRIQLLHDGVQAFPAMLDAIASARHEILLEMYWFGSDATGQRFAEALSRRAREGLDVRVTYDSVGSFEADGTMFSEMEAAGVQVHEFHPVAPWRKNFSLGRINRRNHRKLLVVDGSLAITGGINLADHWAPPEQGGLGFRDDAIQVMGDAAAYLRAVFFRSFPDPPTEIPERNVPEGTCDVTVLASDLAPERRGIRQGYQEAIEAAQRDIIICNSYFIPDRHTRAALFSACERGVRVRVLMPKDSDVRPVQYASRALYGKLMKRGIELFEWNRGVLHSKTAVVDDSWCTVGSFNFDARSLHDNLEINLAVNDPDITRQLRARLESDLAQSSAVDERHFAYRPLYERALERLFYSLRWGL